MPYPQYERQEDIADEISRTEETNSIRNVNYHTKTSRKNDDLPPVVYIDIPDENEQITTINTNNIQQHTNSQTITDNIHGGFTNNADGNTNTLIHDDTIFFDQFENRRIDITTPRVERVNTNTEIIRPTNLRLNQTNIEELRNTNPFASVTPQTFLPRRQTPQDDGFAFNPLPVREYQDPPPAYTENIAFNQPRFGEVHIPTSPQINSAPRNATNFPNVQDASHRQWLQCPYCKMRVRTMVMRETGPLTHFVAICPLIICLFPITIMAYTTSLCKYLNHYCPNCNVMIAYETPLTCQDLVLVKTQPE